MYCMDQGETGSLRAAVGGMLNLEVLVDFWGYLSVAYADTAAKRIRENPCSTQSLMAVSFHTDTII